MKRKEAPDICLTLVPLLYLQASAPCNSNAITRK